MSTIVDLINLLNEVKGLVKQRDKEIVERDEEIRQLKAQIEILNVKKKED